MAELRFAAVRTLLRSRRTGIHCSRHQTTSTEPMKPGDVVLIRLPQATGRLPKLRPALVLSRLPGPYQNVLLAGITTQLQDVAPDWDERMNPADPHFTQRGLHHHSI